MPMTIPTASSLADAERLLPDTGCNCNQGRLERLGYHDEFCTLHYRPAVALAIQAERDKVDRAEQSLGALQTEITEAAYRAWPEAEDCGYDAGPIIDQLAGERDKAEAKFAALEAKVARLREALEPFAEAGDHHTDPEDAVPMAAFRCHAARAALSPQKDATPLTVGIQKDGES